MRGGLVLPGTRVADSAESGEGCGGQLRKNRGLSPVVLAAYQVRMHVPVGVMFMLLWARRVFSPWHRSVEWICNL